MVICIAYSVKQAALEVAQIPRIDNFSIRASTRCAPHDHVLAFLPILIEDLKIILFDQRGAGKSTP